MGKVAILIVAETKIDASFPKAQFSAEGYHKPYRFDVSEKSGGSLVYIKSSTPSRQLHCGFGQQKFESIHASSSFRNKFEER